MRDTRTQVRLRPVIRVFVSSTFSDMKHERNALATDAFPKLEQLCQRHGFQFQAIDLRWGVSTEAGFDHQTMRVCFDELRRAQEISPQPNFLILLGNRYGWRPLPEEISVEEFHTLEHAATQIPISMGKSAVAVMREWYREDTNAVPPVYILQSRSQDLDDGQDYTDDTVWKQVQAVLWTIINRAMPPEHLPLRFEKSRIQDDPPPKIIRFQASATEQEIWHGALCVPDAGEHVLAFFREIENLAAFSDSKQIKDFVDVDPSGRVSVALRTEQGRLKAELLQRLCSANVSRNAAAVRLVETQDNQGDRTTDVTTDHLAQLCADVVSRLSDIIQRQIDEYWRNTTQAPMDRAARELEIEQSEYERFARERGGEESFVGRQAELQAILDYVRSNSCWPLVIHGASGCGKTALLARASQEVAKTRQRIERFIGVAPRSSSLRSLLSSLCQELRQRNPRDNALPTEINELRDEFSQHLQAATPEQPLILFLDALDQLADVDNGRLLNWLPSGSLPAHVKLVVSCLSDRANGDPADQPHAELKGRQIPAENFINLDVLSDAEARLLLFDRWLPKANRKVSDDQRTRIEQRLASPVCRQPIFLKLLFEEVRLWRSYDPAQVPGESVPALLGQFFDRLCQPTNHGPLLVNRVLGYLSASRYGLAENEILEILFADPEYRARLNEATEQTLHELPPNAKRIPIALWSRLRFDLAPYLAERAAPGANILTFYHRQVAEWVQEHLAKSSDLSWQPHHRLANYFRVHADPEGILTWTGKSVRYFIEPPFHLVEGEAWVELAHLLTDWRYFEAAIGQGGRYDLSRAYALAAQRAGKSQLLPQAAALALVERYITAIHPSGGRSSMCPPSLEAARSYLEDIVDRSPEDASCTVVLSAAAAALGTVLVGPASQLLVRAKNRARRFHQYQSATEQGLAYAAIAVAAVSLNEPDAVSFAKESVARLGRIDHTHTRWTEAGRVAALFHTAGAPLFDLEEDARKIMLQPVTDWEIERNFSVALMRYGRETRIFVEGIQSKAVAAAEERQSKLQTKIASVPHEARFLALAIQMAKECRAEHLVVPLTELLTCACRAIGSASQSLLASLETIGSQSEEALDGVTRRGRIRIHEDTLYDALQKPGKAKLAEWGYGSTSLRNDNNNANLLIAECLALAAVDPQTAETLVEKCRYSFDRMNQVDPLGPYRRLRSLDEVKIIGEYLFAELEEDYKPTAARIDSGSSLLRAMIGFARAITKGRVDEALDIGRRLTFSRNEVLAILAHAISQQSQQQRQQLYSQAITYVSQSMRWEAEGVIGMLCHADDLSGTKAFSGGLREYVAGLNEFREHTPVE